MKASFLSIKEVILFILVAFISSCTTKQDKKIKSTPLLGAGFGIVNVSIMVEDLDSTRNYYDSILGFTMPPHKRFQKGIYDGTLTASLSFPDGSSMELLSVNDTNKAKVQEKHSFITSFLKQHEGIRLYSLSTSSADTTLNWLHAQGFKTDSVHAGRFATELPKGWDGDDGGPQYRSVEFNRKDPPAYLPGFVEITGVPYYELIPDWKPYAWRRYYDSNANGAIGIAALRVVVEDLKTASKEFKKMGFTELQSNDTSASFKIAYNQQLHLISSKVPGDEISKFLRSQGSGVYAIRFEVKDLKKTDSFLQKKLPAKAFFIDTSQKRLTVFKEYAHGVQLEFVEESKEQAALAKIYNFGNGAKLDTVSVQHAKVIYNKYCTLCHGKDREGYAADFAPSLRSRSLMETTQKPQSSYNFLAHTISYGRTGTAMAPYAKAQGGPLDRDDIDLLIEWLHQSSGVKKPIEMSTESITGNIKLGKTLYATHCASCHGLNGKGVRGPALANPMFLATASDAFLHYTISQGRDSTPMPAFKDSLSKVEINAITAYLRSRASGWNAPEAIEFKEPLPKDYIINPNKKAPTFTLSKGMYISAEQLLKAVKDSARLIILDARSKAAWYQSHIPGSISVPYYEEPDKFIKDIPNDSTWIVAYCGCPHAASTGVINTLRRFGYKHTAVLDEGIFVWTQRGYPIQNGKENKDKKKKK